MHKDFDIWNLQKQKTHNADVRPLFKEREIWWCKLGVNIGDEEDGKGKLFARPVLVFKKFNHNIFLGIPLSTQTKDNRFYYKFHFKGNEQSLLLSQVRLIDAKRFVNKMGNITPVELQKIRESLRKLIF